MKQKQFFFALVAMLSFVFSGFAQTKVYNAADLKAALESTQDGSVVLGNDIELSAQVTIPKKSVHTLDLNGHKITGGLYVYGTLTIDDKVGTGEMTASTYVLNGAGGSKIILNGGKVYRGSSWSVYTTGAFTVNGGEVENTIRVAGSGTIELNGGTVTNVQVTSGNLKITNSAAKVDGNLSIEKGAKSVNISAGTINGDVTIATEAQDKVAVSGGSFKDADAIKDYLPSGSALLQKPDGTYEIVAGLLKIGDTYYPTLDAALKAAADGATIELIEQKGAVIAMNGSLYGKNVTITGTATVDWSKDWLFVGRGGEGNATLTFDNANLTSASDNASYGIHVSGREKGTADKYDGTLVIKNSTIVLDFLINKGAMTLDNSSLTVKNGFAVGGRPASETESGEDATATMALTNNSKLVVNNHNGMGLGYEAIGVMNVESGSTFEFTKDFVVTAKGTLNVNAATLKSAAKLANLGTINVTNATVEVAKLDNDAPMFLNGTNTIKTDASGSSFAIRVNDGVEFNNSYIKGTANETVRLLGSATFNGGFECAYLQGSSAGQGGTVTIEEGTTVKATYGVEFSKDYQLNGGTIELAGGNASSKFWGCVFQSGTYTINTDVVVNGNGQTLPIHFTNATATINSNISQSNPGGEVIYLKNSEVTVTKDASVASTTGLHVNTGSTLKSAGNISATIKKADDATVEISGGTYTQDVSNWCADGFMTQQNADGSFGIAKAAAKIGDKKYATLEAAFAAATDGQTITMLDDATPALTSQRAITKAAVIDLGGKTLTLKEDDLCFGTTTFKNGTIVVDPSVKASTAVFWMFANQTLTFDNVKIVATGVTGTYLIGLDGNNSDLNLLNGSEILVENTTALDLDIICVNVSTGNEIKVENSKVSVKNLDGRVFFRGNYTVKDSEVNLAGITKAGFCIEAGQTLSIEGTSKVNIEGEPRDGGINLIGATASYTKAETATVNATVTETGFEAKIGDAKYATFNEAVAAAQSGAEVTIFKAGTYNVPSGKNLTITGAVDGVQFGPIAEPNLGMKNYTFNNVTFNYANDSHYKGLQYAGKMEYNNCTFNGQVFLYGQSETFNECTFNQTSADAYNVWTYGAKEVAFNECTFNSAGKSVLIYHENATMFNNVAVTKSTFNASQTVDGKAAIEMDASLTAGINLTIDANTTATGFGAGNVSGKSLWNNKKGNADEANNDITVVVAGETVLAPVFDAKIGEKGYRNLKDAIDAVKAGETVTMLTDLNMSEILVLDKAITLDGNGKKLTSTAGRAINVDCEGNVGIKNLTINAKGERAINVIQKPANVTIENVTATAANYTVNLAGSAANAVVTINKSNLTGLNVVNVAAPGSEITINGGTITCNDQTDAENYAALALNKDAVGAKIAATGVDFVINGDSKKASNGAVGGEITIDGKTDEVAVNVAYISYGNNYYSFTSIEAAIEAAKAGETIGLIRDITASDIITINKAITLDGNGKTLTSTAGRAINVSGADGVTIKNLTIDAKGERAINVIQNATNVTIDGVTATAKNYTVNVAASAPNAVVAIKNSTLNGLCTVNVSAAGANVTVDNSTVNCNDNNTTAGESYAALSLNKEAVDGSIVATNSTINVTDGSDSMKGRNSAENGTVTINGSTDGVAVMVAVITYEGSDYYHSFSSLAEAVEFAKAGDVVTLISDVTMDYGARDLLATAAADKAVTIDGKGHTLTLNQTNSDWSSIGLENNNKLVLKNMTINKAGKGATSGAWNTHAIIFSTAVEMENVTVNNSVAVAADAAFTNVVFKEANGYYSLWIEANGQTVTVKSGSMTATNGGRGIKIADQYINAPAKVKLSVDGTEFNTAKKAAVLVSSKAGAEITAANVNIENVAEDKVNFVWVDGDWATDFGNVTVNGKPAVMEGAASFVAAVTVNGAVKAYYATIVEAIGAVQAGEEVALVADVTASEVILLGKSLTINGNGHKVTSNATRVFRVTVKDTEVTLNDVNMVSRTVMVYPNDIRGISIDAGLQNVELTLNNCSVDFTDATACDWAYAVNVSGNGTGHTVTVNGGTYEGANVINVHGANNTVTVKDATLTSLYPNNDTYYGACIWVLQNQNTSVEATGNTFNGDNAYAFNLGNGNPLTESDNIDNTKYVVAKIGDAYYTSIQDAIEAAQDGETVKLTQNVTIDELVKLEKAITLDLNYKKVTSTAMKAFEVYANATIKNGTIEAVQRCVDTRKAVELTLTYVTLIADKYTSYGNPQPLTIGGYKDGTKVTMTNVNINAADGYGIITFVKTELTATNSRIAGYSALYVKPGSDNSVFNFTKSALSGSNAGNDVEGNSFSTIAVRANNVTVNVDAASTVTAVGNYCDAMSFGGNYAGEESVTNANVTIAGTINGNIMFAGLALNNNVISVKAEYADKLATAGFVTSEADATGLVTIEDVTVLNEMTIKHSAYAGLEFVNENEKKVGTLNYVREFSNTNWQAFYVPFAINYNDIKDDFDVARLNMAHQEEIDGKVQIKIEFISMKAGQTMKANYPYMIRPKQAGAYTFTVKNTTLKKAVSRSIDCSTVDVKFTFTGTYRTIFGDELVDNKYYYMGGGILGFTTNRTYKLNPFNWYMTIEGREDLSDVKFIIGGDFEDEETTGITNIDNDQKNDGNIYDLQGRRVLHPQKGSLYIVNGKKVVY